MILQNTISYADIEDPSDARIPPLLCSLAGGDPVVREKARETLVAIGKPAVPSLIQLLSNRRPLARWEAAKALPRDRRSAGRYGIGERLWTTPMTTFVGSPRRA